MLKPLNNMKHTHSHGAIFSVSVNIGKVGGGREAEGTPLCCEMGPLFSTPFSHQTWPWAPQCLQFGSRCPHLSLSPSLLPSLPTRWTWSPSTSGARTSWWGASIWRTCRPTRRAPWPSSTSWVGMTEESPPPQDPSWTSAGKRTARWPGSARWVRGGGGAMPGCCASKMPLAPRAASVSAPQGEGKWSERWEGSINGTC